MSRRKQGRPQPRKNFEAGLLLQDKIHCGLCNQHFSLTELQSYIYHKAQELNKENELLKDEDCCDENDKKYDRDRSPSSKRVAHVSTSTRDDDDSESTNIYECINCQEVFNDAHLFSQHIQDSHGLKILLDKSWDKLQPPPKTISPNVESSVSLSKRVDRQPLSERQSSLPSQPQQRLSCHNVGLLNLEANGQQDYYSQRLRQLAGATSPTSAATPRLSLIPANYLLPLDDEPVTENAKSTLEPLPFGKKIACEFCGKTFKFKSNLIVHRRIHTGEKPFKCKLCDHACTQASKLKRHMKTHRSIPNGVMTNHHNSRDESNSAHGSPSFSEKKSSSSDKYFSGDSLRDDEETEEDLDDDYEEERLMIDDSIPEDLTIQATSNSSPAPDSGVVDGAEKSDDTPDTPDDKPGRLALLNEVMENTGLCQIQPYRDAYNQILKEAVSLGSCDKNSKSNDDDDLNDDDDESIDTNTSLEDNSDDPKSLNLSVVPFKRKFANSALNEATVNTNHKKSKHESNGISVKKEEDGFRWPSCIPPTGFQNLYLKYDSSSDRQTQQQQQPVFECALKENQQCQSSHASAGSSSSTGTQSANANNHLNLKKERRNDTCEYCGKIFKNCSNLTVHRRSHTGEKPYKCELCNYACAQSSKLTRHMKTHGLGSKESFKCKFCSMPFSVPSTLEKHMRKCMTHCSFVSVDSEMLSLPPT